MQSIFLFLNFEKIGSHEYFISKFRFQNKFWNFRRSILISSIIIHVSTDVFKDSCSKINVKMVFVRDSIETVQNNVLRDKNNVRYAPEINLILFRLDQLGCSFTKIPY